MSQPVTENQSLEQALETVTLTVDADNYILSLSSNWEAVAAAGNAADSLACQKVIGKPLHEFISSDTTRMYVETCLKLCRLKKATLFRPYRCDSTTHKRFMELQLTPLDNQVVEMKHFLLKQEPFETPLHFEDISHDAHALPQLLRCSMCNKVRPIQGDHWSAPEHYQTGSGSTPVIHTICPDCNGMVWQKRSRPR
ncbi:hypothetical protein [Marinospirillum alkaliphilum]|uniref:PAS fold-containing protein n=1 Tax=Marinospirillum alkaliphilum DSM 21637 TaxID=1122209 RepID=A0A1K1WZV6_9GAMM|nr:hypothetical protein [Marinospirillum alkaliphilum]SFX42914.1 hypothetical protein SAMN02745752_01629 [Marinospirillum alkaliphilum DSM 21637]